MNKDNSTILIADDDITIRMILAKNISEWGFNYIEADNGHKALEILNSDNPPRVAILDWMMPGLEGPEICKEIQELSSQNFIYTILLTAKSENKDLITGLDAGAHAFLSKPITPTVLLSHIKLGQRMVALEDQLRQHSRNLEETVAKQVHEIERKKSLERFLAPQLVQTVYASDEPLATQTRRKKLTAFFSDIRGFTSLADTIEPEEVVDLLNDYFAEMTEIIFRHEGTLDKFMGDGIMVFFGDPIRQDDHAQRAVAMAIEMQAAMIELQKKWFGSGSHPIAIGIGINTGYMTVGNIGCNEHMDYTVIGTQVNIAARLESLAEPGEILISHATKGLLDDSFDCEDAGEVMVKGITQPVAIYRVAH